MGVVLQIVLDKYAQVWCSTPMQVYLLSEDDMELLKAAIEKWELEVRAKYSEGRKESGTPVGDTLGCVRYVLYGWINRVKASK